MHPYELFCQFPALSPFYTQIEKTFVRLALAPRHALLL